VPKRGTREPECIDYASADAFLTGKGSRDHNRRPLRDAWNTTLVRDGAHIVVEFETSDKKKVNIVTYEPGGDKIVTLPENTATARDRVNRYGLWPDMSMEAHGLGSIVNIIGEVGTLGFTDAAGNPIAARAPISQAEVGEIITISGGTLAAPRWITHHKRNLAGIRFRTLAADYAKMAVKTIVGEGMEAPDLTSCTMCRNDVPQRDTTGGWQRHIMSVRDPEHVWAHLESQEFDPAVVTTALAQAGYDEWEKLIPSNGLGRYGGAAMESYYRNMIRKSIQSYLYGYAPVIQN
jgi:hypothetical protein